MNAALETLRREVHDDGAVALRRLREAGSRELAHDGDLAVVALALQHAYAALESLLDRAIRFLDGNIPTGHDSHRALLARALLEIPSVRPPLLAAGTAQRARELLRFRHFLHHDYGADLESPRLAELQRLARELEPLLEADLARLDTWLGATSSAG